MECGENRGFVFLWANAQKPRGPTRRRQGREISMARIQILPRFFFLIPRALNHFFLHRALSLQSVVIIYIPPLVELASAAYKKGPHTPNHMLTRKPPREKTHHHSPKNREGQKSATTSSFSRVQRMRKTPRRPRTSPHPKNGSVLPRVIRERSGPEKKGGTPAPGGRFSTLGPRGEHIERAGATLDGALFRGDSQAGRGNPSPVGICPRQVAGPGGHTPSARTVCSARRNYKSGGPSRKKRVWGDKWTGGRPLGL